ncbi:hypothetical protein BSL78_24463 [Apostichopus japonicus]|uniref:Uncharacterized protein n=1 Tax=Stichopus japonicus TaxID=307972 RepID=A0A2G8JSE4_STIJA|nr:hypothetical protein BSL78_24463 [Apostichopus japonicus]
MELASSLVRGAVAGASRALDGSAQVGDTTTELSRKQAERFNHTVGVKWPDDVLLHQESKNTISGVSEIQTHKCTYHCRRNEVITYVEVHDNCSDGTGGIPKITGGQGQDHVTVELMSQLGKGVDFTVSVYGRKG